MKTKRDRNKQPLKIHNLPYSYCVLAWMEAASWGKQKEHIGLEDAAAAWQWETGGSIIFIDVVHHHLRNSVYRLACSSCSEMKNVTSEMKLGVMLRPVTYFMWIGRWLFRDMRLHFGMSTKQNTHKSNFAEVLYNSGVFENPQTTQQMSILTRITLETETMCSSREDYKQHFYWIMSQVPQRQQ